MSQTKSAVRAQICKSVMIVGNLASAELTVASQRHRLILTSFNDGGSLDVMV